MLIEYTLKNGYAPIHPPGLTEWNNLHIYDVSDFFVQAVEATQDPSKANNPEIFGPKGYFFLENGVHKWSDVAKWVAEEAAKQGLIPEPATKEVDFPYFGANSKAVAARARKYFGWTPKGPSLKDDIPSSVALEAKRLGKA